MEPSGRGWRERLRGAAGFTFIELLVVIVVLGILAALAIPNFLNQRQRANDSKAQSLVRNGVGVLEQRFVTADSFATTKSELRNDAPELDDAPSWDLIASGSGYTLSVVSDSGRTFTVSHTAGGEAQRTCTPAGRGQCPSDGVW
jgi:type IV pilus assembly protein PilA